MPPAPWFPRPLTLPVLGLVVVAKADTKQKKRAKRTDPAQFERFIEAARKRGVDESLADFAAKFSQNRAAEKAD